jgi:poly-gamma-glutamate capsule biosynthesis protein CapA/YwtB (metallophosphatase superfamily)
MRKWFVFLGVFLLLDIILFSSYLVFQRVSSDASVVLESGGFISTPTPKSRKVTLMLVGDIMLGRTVNIRSLEKNDPTYPFLKVADKLRGEDIVFANLESPIVEKCPRIESGFTFCADPRMVEGLVFSGVDVVNLANNHTSNFGEQGLEDTKRILSQKSIKWVGERNFETLEKNGIKFGFLGFDLFDNDLLQSYLDFIEESDKKVDVLVVGVHWGREYTPKATVMQEQEAKRMIDAGADVIAGHHPHWVQNTKYVNGKPVFFSLGNFVFDQMWSEETKKGLAVQITYEGKDIVDQKNFPVYTAEWAQPQWVNQNAN